MKIIEKKEDSLVMEAEIDESLANALRRYLNHIPVAAIDEVEIIKNDSPLYDETVAHRIGLIPLKMDKSLKKDAKVKLVAKKDGMVYSGELSGEAKSVYEKMPITFLNKGQEFEINAVTKTGKGIEHSKFSPGMIFYRNVAEITVDRELQNEIKKALPNNEVKEKGNKIVVLDNKKQEVGDICDNIASEHKKKAEVEFKDSLIITVESFGQMPSEEIFKKSIEELREDLSEFSKKISKE